MAKIKNKKSDGSLIFTWIIILLITLATAVVVVSHLNEKREYKLNHSEIIANQEIASALSDTLDKPAGLITHEDLNKIEAAYVMVDMPVSFDDGASTIVLSSIEFQLEGYAEAHKAYNAEGVTEEDKKNMVNPADLVGYVYLSEISNLDDLKLLNNLKTFNALNYGTTVNTKFDFIKMASENYPELTSLIVAGFNTTDVSSLNNLTKLEILGFDGAAVTDISAIASLTSLKNLAINGTSVSDISAIASLANLEDLNLNGNKITDISALASLNNDKITAIDLTGNNITDFSPIAHIDASKVTTDETEAVEKADGSEIQE